ncbi:FAD:protein FMN transferase [Amycolatopsis sp. cmx-4-68]|uniref:FAD:protein FMN transferase n=1 Tax=Amycolatopsis sp. cmx-4-68 TaxID=2790938 RepID=UPI00397C3374
MPVSLHIRGDGVRADPAVEPAVAAVFTHLRAVGRLFSTYRPDSQISRIRRHVDNAVEQLARPGPYDHYLNAGGDIAAAARPGATAWRVGIEDPRDRTRLLSVRELRGGGLATTGTAARGARIVDPRTGGHPTAIRSVTVSGPRLLWADVYATAAIARSGDVERWIRARAPDYEAFTVLRAS